MFIYAHCERDIFDDLGTAKPIHQRLGYDTRGLMYYAPQGTVYDYMHTVYRRSMTEASRLTGLCPLKSLGLYASQSYPWILNSLL